MCWLIDYHLTNNYYFKPYPLNEAVIVLVTSLLNQMTSRCLIMTVHLAFTYCAQKWSLFHQGDHVSFEYFILEAIKTLHGQINTVIRLPLQECHNLPFLTILTISAHLCIFIPEVQHTDVGNRSGNVRPCLAQRMILTG